MFRILGISLLLLVLAAPVHAGRTPSRKTVLPPSTGARRDITVPYLTNGRTTLGVWNFVGPAIYPQRVVTDTADLQGRLMFNLIFYGSRLESGSASFGAAERPPNQLRPRR